jgi:hypothetical protein
VWRQGPITFVPERKDDPVSRNDAKKAQRDSHQESAEDLRKKAANQTGDSQKATKRLAEQHAEAAEKINLED